MRPHKRDDLWNALMFNPPKLFQPEQIADIVAEVPGENDELAWWWILKLSDGRYVLLEAWCDYTGWDCQSGIDIEEIHETARLAALAAPKEERYSSRNIQRNLIAQIDGKQPLYTYIEEP